MARILVQTAAFDTGAELARLTTGRSDIGGIGCFVGTVRDTAAGRPIAALTLEHYPGHDRARPGRRSPPKPSGAGTCSGCTVIHRVGRLLPGANDRAGAGRLGAPASGAGGDGVPDRLAEDQGAVLEEGRTCRRGGRLGRGTGDGYAGGGALVDGSGGSTAASEARGRCPWSAVYLGPCVWRNLAEGSWPDERWRGFDAMTARIESYPP